MLPVVLNPQAIRVGVAGKGDGLQRRLELLDRLDAQPVVFQDRLPSNDELGRLNLLFVAGLGPDASKKLAAAAHAAGILVNVEDQPDLCDFHVPASVRRGDLLFTVSTSGRSPGLSRIMREELERRFGPEWEEHLEELAQSRSAWRASGVKPDEVSARTKALVASKGWLE